MSCTQGSLAVCLVAAQRQAGAHDRAEREKCPSPCDCLSHPASLSLSSLSLHTRVRTPHTHTHTHTRMRAQAPSSDRAPPPCCPFRRRLTATQGRAQFPTFESRGTPAWRAPSRARAAPARRAVAAQSAQAWCGEMEKGDGKRERETNNKPAPASSLSQTDPFVCVLLFRHAVRLCKRHLGVCWWARASSVISLSFRPLPPAHPSTSSRSEFMIRRRGHQSCKKSKASANCYADTGRTCPVYLKEPKKGGMDELGAWWQQQAQVQERTKKKKKKRQTK